MPCVDGREREYEAQRTKEHEDALREIAELTSMLCETIKCVGAGAVPSRAFVWWQEHQQADLTRMDRMRRDRRASIARLKRTIQEATEELAELERQP